MVIFQHEVLMDMFQRGLCAISLSTFNGEDYGRFLVEALSKVCLSLQQNGVDIELNSLSQVSLVPIAVHEKNLNLDIEKLFKAIENISQSRKENIERFIKLFNHEDKSKILKEIFNEAQLFDGYNKKPFIYIMQSDESWNKKEFFELHEEILQPYWS